MRKAFLKCDKDFLKIAKEKYNYLVKAGSCALVVLFVGKVLLRFN